MGRWVGQRDCFDEVGSGRYEAGGCVAGYVGGPVRGPFATMIVAMVAHYVVVADGIIVKCVPLLPLLLLLLLLLLGRFECGHPPRRIPLVAMWCTCMSRARTCIQDSASSLSCECE